MATSVTFKGNHYRPLPWYFYGMYIFYILYLVFSQKKFVKGLGRFHEWNSDEYSIYLFFSSHSLKNKEYILSGEIMPITQSLLYILNVFVPVARDSVLGSAWNTDDGMDPDYGSQRLSAGVSMEYG